MTLNIETQPVHVGSNLDFNTKSVEEDEDLEDGEILEEGEVTDDDEDEDEKQVGNQENVKQDSNKQKEIKTEINNKLIHNKNNEQNKEGRKRKKRWDDVEEGSEDRIKDKKFRKTEDSNKAPFAPPPDDDLNEDEFMMCVRGASPTRNEISPIRDQHDELRDGPLDDDYYQDYEYDSEGENDSKNDFRRRPFNSRGRGGRGRGRTTDRRGRGGRFDVKRGGRGGMGHDRMKNERGDREKGRRNDNQDLDEIPEGVCQYFMQGKCHRGDNCPYSHDANPPRKMELCKFYLLECCAKKDKCLYMHHDFPCKYYHTGLNCLDGEENCKFSHGELSDEHRNILLKHLELAPKEILGDFPRLSREGALAMMQNKEANKPIPSLFDIKVKKPEGVLLNLDKENSNSNETPIPSDNEEDLVDEQNNLDSNQQQQHHHHHLHGRSPNHHHQNNVDKEQKRKEKAQHRYEKAKRKAERELKRLVKAEKRKKHSEKKRERKSSEEREDNEISFSDEDEREDRKPREKKRKTKNKFDEPGEHKDDGGIPDHLPQKQKELFRRIQAHQREAETNQKSDNNSDDNDSEETAPGHSYEHWYSSDEEGSTPLTTILKTLNQKTQKQKPLLPTPSVPQKIPLLPTPTHIPNTPGYIDPSLKKVATNDLYEVKNSPISNSDSNSNSMLPNLYNIDINQEEVSRLLSSLQTVSGPAKVANTITSSAPSTIDTFNSNTLRLPDNSVSLADNFLVTNTMVPSSNVPLPVITNPLMSNITTLIREQTQPVPVKRDPRLSRSSHTIDQPRPLIESTRPVVPPPSDPMLLLKDVDLRLPTLAPLVPPPAPNKDVDLRSLPFKPVPNHEACTQIQASINSHPPIPWKLTLCIFEPRDYLQPILKAKTTPNDPRIDPLRKSRRRSSDEIPVVSPNSNNPTNVLPRDPRKNICNPIAKPFPERRMSDPRQPVIDHRPGNSNQKSPSYDSRYELDNRFSIDSNPRQISDSRQIPDPRFDPREKITMSESYSRHFDPRMKRSDPRSNQEDFRFSNQDSDFRTNNELGNYQGQRTNNDQGRFQGQRISSDQGRYQSHRSSNDQGRYQDTDLRLPSQNYHRS